VQIRNETLGVDGSASSRGQEKYALASLGLRLR